MNAEPCRAGGQRLEVVDGLDFGSLTRGDFPAVNFLPKVEDYESSSECHTFQALECKPQHAGHTVQQSQCATHDMKLLFSPSPLSQLSQQ